MDAVPAEESCAVPRSAVPVQKDEELSQNSTRPGVTGLPLLVTVAVSVTAVPRVAVAPEVVSAVVELSGGGAATTG
jgi:hypothetical protein